MGGFSANQIARSRRGASSAGVRIGAVFFLELSGRYSESPSFDEFNGR